MLPLVAKNLPGDLGFCDRGVFRVCETPTLPLPARGQQALLVRSLASYREGFPLTLSLAEGLGTPKTLLLPASFSFLRDGDVIRFDPSARSIAVLYRRNSNHNSLLVTERCNHYCIMCSQPPRKIDDSYIVDELLEAIPLMSDETKSIGLTGGEPTLLGDGFLRILRSLKNNLPQTAVHVLSNGRRFADTNFCAEIARLNIADLMIGIPVYSSVPEIHNFVVQAENAWDETIQGILNLRRFGIPVEIRVVLHSQTCDTLVRTADFIVRNLTMVNHVAFMGLERVGFGATNWEYLFVNPREYASALAESVCRVGHARIPVSIYNIPLCMLPTDMYRFATRSISDWKNDYPEECKPCVLKPKCAGFFSSTVDFYSKLVRPKFAEQEPD
jgi:His-Xaa-Ser system radical SAM maturase HxsC